MKKSTKKKLLTLLILVALLIGLIVGAVILKKAGEEEPDTPPEDNSVTVFDKGTAIATKIHFINKAKSNEMSFTYVNEDWVYDKDANFPLDQDRVATMAQAIGTVTATVTVKDPSDDLSVYGLAEPSITVNAQFSDGSEKQFLFGNTNSFNSCVYFKLSGDDSIYMVEEDVAEPFSADLDYLYEPESFILMKESVTDDDVFGVVLTANKGSTVKEITDFAGICEIYELIYTLDVTDYEDYYADNGEMAATYGIKKDGTGESITVRYKQEEMDEELTEYTIYLGHKFENLKEETESEESAKAETEAESETAEGSEPSHYYFFSFNDSTVVYRADGETVDEIFSYLSYEPAPELETAE
ncbi:MAG: DUF4340 domain-containing protein [Clostridia bacterium]|nr:DUF4340 domain-containing protein [Clostridia bacterium]